jgi:ribosomal protein L29
MKENDKEKLSQMTVQELKAELENVGKKLIEAKFKLSRGQLNNVRLPGELRNKIAVIKTLITKKEDSAEQNKKDE